MFRCVLDKEVYICQGIKFTRWRSPVSVTSILSAAGYAVNVSSAQDCWNQCCDLYLGVDLCMKTCSQVMYELVCIRRVHAFIVALMWLTCFVACVHVLLVMFLLFKTVGMLWLCLCLFPPLHCLPHVFLSWFFVRLRLAYETGCGPLLLSLLVV